LHDTAPSFYQTISVKMHLARWRILWCNFWTAYYLAIRNWLCLSSILSLLFNFFFPLGKKTALYSQSSWLIYGLIKTLVTKICLPRLALTSNSNKYIAWALGHSYSGKKFNSTLLFGEIDVRGEGMVLVVDLPWETLFLKAIVVGGEQHNSVFAGLKRESCWCWLCGQQNEVLHCEANGVWQTSRFLFMFEWFL